MKDVDTLIARAGLLIDRLEALLPAPAQPPDWRKARALRWRRGRLEMIAHPHTLRLNDLRCIDTQKHAVVRNTRQFLAGLPANNVLLWGARGTGKSSLIKALLHAHGKDGLRLIEVDKANLTDLPDIIDAVYDRPERFILFCDDLSFEADDAGYKTLKAILDGSLASLPANLLIYASSNRRHLLAESMRDNLDVKRVDDELHPGEAIEEKISLSERFGVWLSFYPFTQDEYLSIVGYWLKRLKYADIAAARDEALRWGLARGSRSGRVAQQFARDYVGRLGLKP